MGITRFLHWGRASNGHDEESSVSKSGMEVDGEQVEVDGVVLQSTRRTRGIRSTHTHLCSKSKGRDGEEAQKCVHGVPSILASSPEGKTDEERRGHRLPFTSKLSQGII